MTLRCHRITDRIATDKAPIDDLRERLTTVLLERVAEQDGPGAATVLGALTPLLARLPDCRTSVKWFQQHYPVLSTVSRCGDKDRCPSCGEDLACPLDVWWQPLVETSLTNLTMDSAKVAYWLRGQKEGRGVLETWRRKCSIGFSDYAGWVLYRWYVDRNHIGRGHRLLRRLYEDGWRDPRIIDARLARLQVRYTGQVDDDGNPIPKRIHAARTPRRLHPTLFSRAGGSRER